MIARLDALLTPQRLRVYPVMLLVAFAVVWVARIVLDRSSLLPDFRARWTAGRILLDGRAGQLYDLGVQSAVQERLGAHTLSWFVSPPPVALLFVPFAALPYAVAAVAWVGLSVSGLALTVRLLRPWWPSTASGMGGAVLLAAASQPVLELIGAGQDSWVPLLACAGALALAAQGRAVLAGLTLSGGLVKPHLLVVAVVVLGVLRRWRVLLGLAAGAAAGLGLGTLMVGGQAWTEWWSALSSSTYLTEVGVGQVHKGVSIQAFVTALAPPGWASQAAMVGLILGLLLFGAWVAWALLKRPPDRDVIVSAGVLTLLVVPHAMVYDVVLVLPCVASLVVTRSTARMRVTVAAGFLLMWLAPLTHLMRDAPWPTSALAAPWVTLALLALLWTTTRHPRSNS